MKKKAILINQKIYENSIERIEKIKINVKLTTTQMSNAVIRQMYFNVMFLFCSHSTILIF